ncbi:MAG: 3-deoxy-7-phosphoheptulonate synthase [Proteobacteria bacterium]|nr:3-deoxy-7-phosphoheptulonate synthase [Pseudomonadota bacterium]
MKEERDMQAQMETVKRVENLPIGVGGAAPPERLFSRASHRNDTCIPVGPARIGAPNFVVIAGPCSVESRDQMMETADAVKNAGAGLLRGGAFKPRTSPYSFQGLGEEGLKLLAQARMRTGLPVITEVMDTSEIDLIEAYTDIIQVGARNVQNFSLLKKLGRTRKPVLLKRGLMTTLDEFLMSAEYVLASGNEQVILCERGIRTFETATRNTLDISAVLVLKERTHLPVIVDPSHAVGNRRYVGPLAKAALAVGADGIMIEVHAHPAQALCDGDQSLRPEELDRLMADLKLMAPLFGRLM